MPSLLKTVVRQMANDAMIDRLVVQVSVEDTDGAAGKINDLARAMENLNKASDQGNKAKFNRFADSMAAMSEAAEKVKSTDVADVAEKIKSLSAALGKIKPETADNLKAFTKNLNKATADLVQFGALKLDKVAANAKAIDDAVSSIKHAASTKNINFDGFATVAKSIGDNAAAFNSIGEIKSTGSAGTNVTDLMMKLSAGAKYIEGATAVAQSLPGIVEPLSDHIAELSTLAGMKDLGEAGKGLESFLQTLQKIGGESTKGVLPGANAIAGALDKFTNLNVSAFAGSADGLKVGIASIKSFARFISTFEKPETKDIDALAATLKKIATAMKGMPSSFNGEGIKAALTAIAQYGDLTTNAAQMSRSLEELGRALGNLGGESSASNIEKAFGVVSQIAESAQTLSKAGNGVNNLARGLAKLPEALSNYKKPEAYSALMTGLTRFIEMLNDAISKFDVKGANSISGFVRALQTFGSGGVNTALESAGKSLNVFLSDIAGISPDTVAKLQGNADALWNAVHRLVQASSNLASANKRYPEIGVQYDALAKKIVDFVNTITSNVTPEAEARIVSLSTAIKDLVSSYRSLGPAKEAVTKSGGGSGIWDKGTTSKLLGTVWNGFTKGLKTAVTWYQKLGSAATSAGKKIASLAAKPFTAFIDKIRSAKATWDRLTSSITRIAWYRIVRSAIKAVTDGLKTGIENLYGWSNLVGNSFKPTMDSFATSFQYLKNSIGAAVSPLLDALAPAIEIIINKLVECINVFNQFVAAITGAETWRKALRKEASYIDDTGNSAKNAAKELDKLLLGIDELNRLPSDKDSSSGSSSNDKDYSGMFTVENVDSMFSDWINTDDWTDIGTAISDYLADGLEKANKWMETTGIKTAQSWGTRLATALNGVFANKKFAKNLGKAVGNGINVATKFVTTYVDTTKWDSLGSSIATALEESVKTVDWEALGKTVSSTFKIMTGILHGFVTSWTSADAVELGKSIGTAVNAAWNNVPWTQAIPDAVTFATRVLETLNSAAKTIRFDDMIHQLCEGIKTADWQSFWAQITIAIETLADQNWDQIGTDIGQSLNTMLTTFPWETAIPDLVDLATALLTGINNALAQIEWGPAKKEGTVLNKIYTGIKNADWGDLWDNAIDFIKLTKPVWELAIDIKLAATLLNAVGTFTRDSIMATVFGDLWVGGTLALGTVFAGVGIGLILDKYSEEIDVALQPVFDGLNKKMDEFSDSVDDWFAKIFPNRDEFAEKWNDFWGGEWGQPGGLAEMLDKWGAAIGEWYSNAIADVRDFTVTYYNTFVAVWNELIDKIVLQIKASPFAPNFLADWMEALKLDPIEIEVKGDVTSATDQTGGKTVVDVTGRITTGDIALNSSNFDLTADPISMLIIPDFEWSHGNALLHGTLAEYADKLGLIGEADMPATANVKSWDYDTYSNGVVIGLSNVEASAFAHFNGYKHYSDGSIAGLDSPWSWAESIFNEFRWKSDPWSWAESIFNEFRWKSDPWSYAESIFNVFRWKSDPWSWAESIFNVFRWLETPWSYAEAYIDTYYTKAAGGGWTLMTKESGGVYSGGTWHDIASYASGTSNAPMGQMFIAREAGPELVGTLGGHTAVMNNDQIVASVSSGVARAMASVRFQLKGLPTMQTLYSPQIASSTPQNDSTSYNDNIQEVQIDEDMLYRAFKRALDETDFGLEVDLDGEPLYQNMARRNRQNTRMTGVNAFG